MQLTRMGTILRFARRLGEEKVLQETAGFFYANEHENKHVPLKERKQNYDFTNVNLNGKAR